MVWAESRNAAPALAGALMLYSPGNPKPFLDKDGRPLAGSVAEKIRIDVNGVEQGMFIKSTDATHPVLLYLHGGPPDYFLTGKAGAIREGEDQSDGSIQTWTSY